MTKEMLVPVITFKFFADKIYSYLSASIGSRLAAFAAGRIPNRTPTNPEKPSANAIDQNGMVAGGNPGIEEAINVPKPNPAASPISPPSKDSNKASIKNCIRM